MNGLNDLNRPPTYFELLNFELPQGFERSIAIENKSAHGELVEPLELAIAWVKGVSTDSQAVCNRLDDRVHGGN